MAAAAAAAGAVGVAATGRAGAAAATGAPSAAMPFSLSSDCLVVHIDGGQGGCEGQSGSGATGEGVVGEAVVGEGDGPRASSLLQRSLTEDNKEVVLECRLKQDNGSPEWVEGKSGSRMDKSDDDVDDDDDDAYKREFQGDEYGSEGV